LVEQVLAPNIQNYRNSGITVTLEFDENLPLVQLDQEKIKQVILNLSKNAFEAMPKGGFLTGVTCPVLTSCLNSTMPARVSPRVSSYFIFSKPPNPKETGLGLSIVQQIISDHHGTVNYVSELGKGTTFRVSLPTK